MCRLEVSGAVRPIYGSLGVKRLIKINYAKHLTFQLQRPYCNSIAVFQILHRKRLSNSNMKSRSIKCDINTVTVIRALSYGANVPASQGYERHFMDKGRGNYIATGTLGQLRIA